MIFNEIYGNYYNAVAKIIELAIDGNLNDKEINKIATSKAFDESALAIESAIKKQEWQLIDENMETPILDKPQMPLTLLQKRWLKTILLDKRIVLFDVPDMELDDVEPLFLPEDVVYFDRYLDGDDYMNPDYIAHFKTIIQAIKEHRKVEIKYMNNRNKERICLFSPIKMEYSDKDDKFRVLSAGERDVRTVNMARIISCELTNETFEENLELPIRNKGKLVFELRDERNTLERVLMKFAHCKKQVEKTGDNTYHVELEYDKDEETDVVIQIMSFGTFISVLAPMAVKHEIKERIKKQFATFFP